MGSMLSLLFIARFKCATRSTIRASGKPRTQRMTFPPLDGRCPHAGQGAPVRAFIYSLKILLAPLSQRTMTSLPFSVTGSPVAVSM